jgi:hypothetical protein
VRKSAIAIFNMNKLTVDLRNDLILDIMRIMAELPINPSPIIGTIAIDLRVTSHKGF